VKEIVTDEFARIAPPSVPRHLWKKQLKIVSGGEQSIAPPEMSLLPSCEKTQDSKKADFLRQTWRLVIVWLSVSDIEK
jgi:hypothetical protein